MSNVVFTATQWTGTSAPASSDVDGTSENWSTTPAQTVVTNAKGLADFTNLADGYYLFQQTTTVNGIATVRPFIVQVNHSDSQAGVVNVYPKLDISSSSMLGTLATVSKGTVINNYNTNNPNDVDTNSSNGTVSATTGSAAAAQNLKNSDNNAGNAADANGSWGYDATGDNANTTTAGMGDTVNWNVNTVFDSSQTNNNTITKDSNNTAVAPTGSYQVIDKLPSNVTLSGTTITVNYTKSDGTAGSLTLTQGTDFTVGSDNTVTITLSPAEQQQIAKDLGNTDGALNFVIPTTITTATPGTYQDSPSTLITNAYGADLSTKATSDNVSTINVGGVDFTKTDGTNPITNVAKGAKFVLVKAKNLKAAQDFEKTLTISSTGEITDGNVSNDTAELVNTDGTVPTTASAVSVVTMNTADGSVGSWSGLNLVDNNTDKTNTDNYYVVELVSPTGYVLPDTGTAANVFSVKADTTPAASDSSVANKKPFILPFTGGEGLTGIIIIATVAGLAAFAIRRRRDNEEEQA